MRVFKKSLNGLLCLAVVAFAMMSGVLTSGSAKTERQVMRAPTLETLSNGASTVVVPPVTTPNLQEPSEEYRDAGRKFLATAGLFGCVGCVFFVPALIAIVAERSNRKRKQQDQQSQQPMVLSKDEK